MLNSIINDINNIDLFNDESNWIIDLIPKLSTYNCIRGYLSGFKLNKIVKKSTFNPTFFYKIIIYIDDDSGLVDIIYFDTEKHIEKNIVIHDSSNDLSSLLKAYTVIKDSLELNELQQHSKL